jgi:hypothetical protein
MHEGLAAAYERDRDRFDLGVFCNGCDRLVPSHECHWCDLEGGGVTVTDERLAPEPDGTPKPEPGGETEPEPEPT